MVVENALRNDYLWIIVTIVAVALGFGKFIHMALLTRWHIRHVEQVLTRSPLSSVEIAVAVMNKDLPIDDRARLLGMGINEAFLTAKEFGDSVSAMMRGVLKPGAAAPTGTLAVVEEMEADVVQPPVFWAVEGLGNRWIVLYQDANGWEVGVFPRVYPALSRNATELEARYVAAVLNLDEASRRERRPMLSYDDYRLALAELFGDVYA